MRSSSCFFASADDFTMAMAMDGVLVVPTAANSIAGAVFRSLSADPCVNLWTEDELLMKCVEFCIFHTTTILVVFMDMDVPDMSLI